MIMKQNDNQMRGTIDVEEILDEEGNPIHPMDPRYRTAKMNKLVEQNEEELSEEIDFDSLTSEEDESVSDEDIEVKEEEVVEVNPVKETKTPAKILRKINGVETEITDDIIEKAMKIASADKYLDDAKALKSSARKPLVEESEIEDNFDYASAVNALQMGQAEEAIEVLKTLRKSGKSSINLDAVRSEVSTALQAEQAKSWFTKEYSDVWDDPILKKMAEDMDYQLWEEDPEMSIQERMAVAGNKVRTWKQETLTKWGAVVPGKTNDKQSRKDNGKPTPKSASKRQEAIVDEENGEENQSELIAAMAQKRRGY